MICDSAGFTACLVAGERLPSGDRSRARSFEAIWTVEPVAVREAARTAVSLAEPHHPALAERLKDALSRTPDSDAQAARTATILVNRIAAELDGMVVPRRR